MKRAPRQNCFRGGAPRIKFPGAAAPAPSQDHGSADIVSVRLQAGSCAPARTYHYGPVGSRRRGFSRFHGGYAIYACSLGAEVEMESVSAAECGSSLAPRRPAAPRERGFLLVAGTETQVQVVDVARDGRFPRERHFRPLKPALGLARFFIF